MKLTYRELFEFINTLDKYYIKQKLFDIAVSTRQKLYSTYHDGKKTYRKFLLVAGLLIVLFFVVGFTSSLYKTLIPEVVQWSAVDVDYVLPIGNATDKDYYITRPNGKDDGGVVRVMFAIASTRIDWMLCYAVASAYFTNIPVVVTGYKEENYSNVNKPRMFLHAVEQAGLQDSDVALALDSDIMFTGLDYLPFIDKFIKLSPANLNELDAKAVRTGQAMAPSTYGTEGWCWTPQTLAFTWQECQLKYYYYYEKHRNYTNSLTEFTLKPFVNYDDNKLFYLNSGTSIHRVWAMRELFAAFHKFMATNKPIDNRQWWEDQSVFAKLYLELRMWEIQQDYFRKRTDELRSMSNENGLHAGMMGLDLKGELSVMGHLELIKEVYELRISLWPEDMFESDEIMGLFLTHTSLFLAKNYKKLKSKNLLIERNLTRSYSNIRSVTISPPLLSLIPRHVNGKDKPAERVFPMIMHFAGALKYKRENDALNYTQWFLPMMFDKEQWIRGKQYVMSMPVELWTDNNEQLRVRYSDVCKKHPFNRNGILDSLDYENQIRSEAL